MQIPIIRLEFFNLNPIITQLCVSPHYIGCLFGTTKSFTHIFLIRLAHSTSPWFNPAKSVSPTLSMQWIHTNPHFATRGEGVGGTWLWAAGVCIFCGGIRMYDARREDWGYEEGIVDVKRSKDLKDFGDDFRASYDGKYWSRPECTPWLEIISEWYIL
jgi:hypothetical protein